jgi:cell division protein FtsL
MKRIAISFSTVALALVGVGLFHVAQNVRDYESQLKMLNNKIASEQETTHTLEAEWFYLNQPDRLERLAKIHTDLKIINEKNLISLSVVPLLPILTEEEVQEITTLEENSKSHNEYVSKTNKKTSFNNASEITIPVHQISLRDIWGQ